jgi:hypothetical protein
MESRVSLFPPCKNIPCLSNDGVRVFISGL